jgi:tetratricopeptide (TPR) repeat protein
MLGFMKVLIAALMLLAATAPAVAAASVDADRDAKAEQAISDERAAQREKLFRYLAAATTEQEGRAVEDEIWHFWLDLAPDAPSRAFVDQAMERRESYDFRKAEELLDEAIARAPNYAEAWNQRAFIRFLRENYAGAEEDLHRALEIEPKHFGALSGLFHVLFRQGRTEAANAALEKAVAIHPWLKERSMLPPDPDAVRPPVKGREQDL